METIPPNTQIAPRSTTKLITVAVIVVGLCAFNLWRTAATTGNTWGALVSIVHVSFVALATVLALRE